MVTAARRGQPDGSARARTTYCSAEIPGVFGMCGPVMCDAIPTPIVATSVSYETHSSERLLQRGDRQWIVREVNARGVPGARRETCLICESAEVIRRIWDFPSDWRLVDEDALWKLCDGSAR
jgi:hypothetical protein